MSKSFDESRLSQDEQRQRMILVDLVNHYESIRRERSQARDRIERALGLELSRYGPFRHQGKIWQWSWLDDSVICRPSPHMTHLPPQNQKRESIEAEVP